MMRRLLKRFRAKSPKPLEENKKEMNTGKSIEKSKTFWFNLLVIAAAIFAAVQGTDVIQANPTLVGIFGAVVGGLNILLRIFTKEPVK